MTREVPQSESAVDRAFLAVTLCGMLSLMTSNSASFGDERVTPKKESVSIADITEEWRSREDRSKTVQMRWHLNRDSDYGSGGYQLEFPRSDDTERGDDFDIIRFSGDRVCYETQRWFVDVEGEFAGYDNEYLFSQFVRSMQDNHDDVAKWDRPAYHFRLIRNSATHRELFNGVTGTPPLGAIRDSNTALMLASENGISSGLLIWPALMAFRTGIALGRTSTDRRLVIESELSKIGNHQCAVVAQQFGEEGMLRLWVAPEMKYAVLRAMVNLNGYVQQQIDIDYEQDQNKDWFPRAWTITVSKIAKEYPGQSEGFQSVKVVVDDCTLNGAVDSSQFDMDFPIGTIVNDKVMSTAYVILSNAKPRPPKSHELRLLSGKTEPHLVKSGTLISRNTVIGSALAVSFVTLWALRRRRTRSSNINSTVSNSKTGS